MQRPGGLALERPRAIDSVREGMSGNGWPGLMVIARSGVSTGKNFGETGLEHVALRRLEASPVAESGGHARERRQARADAGALPEQEASARAGDLVRAPM